VIYCKAMTRLYILAGIPGSGKSTWAKNMFPDATYVSSDEIRLKMYPSLEEANRVPDANARVFAEFHLRVEEYLNLPDNDVVADATCLTKDSRSTLLKIAREFNGCEVHLVLFVNTGQALIRNKERNADLVVPEKVMNEKMMPRLTETKRSLNQGDKKLYDSVTYIAAVS
jgi:predicted kinase